MEEVSAVRIPNFIPSDPALWFTMVESTFELAVPKAISESKTKYNHCVANLPPDIAMTVRDVIISPDQTDPYGKLKQEVISRCGESKSQEIRRLLAGEQLGDRKPSELLRVMQRRAESHNIADTLLLELFLQQLPSNVQSILASISPLTPPKAAKIADKILDISPSQVSAVSDNSSELHVFPDSELLKEIKLLRKEVALLRRSRSNSRPRQSHFRQKSPSDTEQLCWYHQKFASKAKKCIPPCSKQENINGKE
jgi:hypothetical protein